MPLVTLAPTPRTRGFVAFFLFFIAWLLGNVTFIVGLERDAHIPAVCIFAIVAALWWAAYRLSLPAHTQVMAVGFGILGLWMLGLLVPLIIAFHETSRNPFFWFATAAIALLIVGAARNPPPSDPS